MLGPSPHGPSAGRLASFTYPGATLTPTYDDKGHLTAVAGPGAESLQAVYDGPPVTSLSMTGVATGTVAWTYDTRFRANREEVNGAHGVDVYFDDDGLPTDIGYLGLKREATTGRVSEAIVSYDVTTSFAYTPFGEVASAVTKAGETNVLDLAFTYDILGRIVEKKDTGVVWAYGYDLAGRLSTVKKDGANVATYTYDANGNRLNDGATYDEEDRQLSGGGATFTYTPNGERKTRVDGAGTTTYDYDGRGHLTSVALPGGKTLAYGLDALGRRVSRSEDGVITHRWLFRSQLQPVAEVDASGEVTTRYVYGTKVNVPDYFVRGGVTYAVLTDQLGSVRKVVDESSGEVVQEMAYDAWGVVTLDTNPGFQPFGFAGGVFESATGLVHFGAREYEPATGRWTRKDPIRFGGGSAGLYEYVGGRASDRSDASGLRSGDRYRSIDEAGTAAVTEWVPLSRLLDVELGGRIYRLEDGTFSYSDVVYGTPTSVGTGRASIPDGASEVGRFHTHAAPRFGAGDERFSPQDRSNARLHAKGLRCEDYLYFLGTPGGLVGIFHPGSESEVYIGPVPSLLRDP